MNYKYIIVCILLLTVAFFFGCDDDLTGPDGEGSFTVIISGDISREFSGTAIFATNKDEHEEGFILMLTSDEEEVARIILFELEVNTIPGKGTHPIDNYQDETTFYAWYGAIEHHEVFDSESGSMTVTTSSDKRFAGSFEFNATGLAEGDFETKREVKITGTFEAVRVPSFYF